MIFAELCDLKVLVGCQPFCSSLFISTWANLTIVRHESAEAASLGEMNSYMQMVFEDSSLHGFI